MKYRYIVSTICCLLFWEPVSQAQEVAWFEAEGNVYYEVTNCRPLSDVMFYSADKGGKLLQTITTDENGRFQASERITLGKTSASIVPVAALNTKK